jgi:hypothetical protein
VHGQEIRRQEENGCPHAGAEARREGRCPLEEGAREEGARP